MSSSASGKGVAIVTVRALQPGCARGLAGHRVPGVRAVHPPFTSTRSNHAIVQGGAGGIGKAFAETLLGRGYGVVLADIMGAETAAAEMMARRGHGGRPVCVGVRADVTKEEDLERVFSIAREVGPIRVVCNNAGIAAPMLESIDTQTAINLVAVMKGTRMGIDALTADSKGGLIVNTASVAGVTPVDFTPVYAATKAGVVHFTRSLKWMAAAQNVRVVAICPNFTDTRMVSEQLVDPSFRAVVKAQRGGLLTPAQVAKALEFVLDNDEIAGEAVVVTADKGCRVHAFGRRSAEVSAGEQAAASPRPRL